MPAPKETGQREAALHAHHKAGGVTQRTQKKRLPAPLRPWFLRLLRLVAELAATDERHSDLDACQVAGYKHALLRGTRRHAYTRDEPGRAWEIPVKSYPL